MVSCWCRWHDRWQLRHSSHALHPEAPAAAPVSDLQLHSLHVLWALPCPSLVLHACHRLQSTEHILLRRSLGLRQGWNLPIYSAQANWLDKSKGPLVGTFSLQLLRLIGTAEQMPVGPEKDQGTARSWMCAPPTGVPTIRMPTCRVCW